MREGGGGGGGEIWHFQLCSLVLWFTENIYKKTISFETLPDHNVPEWGVAGLRFVQDAVSNL